MKNERVIDVRVEVWYRGYIETEMTDEELSNSLRACESLYDVENILENDDFVEQDEQDYMIGIENFVLKEFGLATKTLRELIVKKSILGFNILKSKGKGIVAAHEPLKTKMNYDTNPYFMDF